MRAVIKGKIHFHFMYFKNYLRENESHLQGHLTERRQSPKSLLALIPATNCFLLPICPHLCPAFPSSLAQITSFLIHIRRSKLITASLPALHPYGHAHLGGGCRELVPLNHPHPAMCRSQEMTFGHH